MVNGELLLDISARHNVKHEVRMILQGLVDGNGLCRRILEMHNNRGHLHTYPYGLGGSSEFGRGCSPVDSICMMASQDLLNLSMPSVVGLLA